MRGRKKSIECFTIKTVEHPVYGTLQVKVYEPKKEYKKRIDKYAKKALDNTLVFYDVNNEAEENRMYAGISQIYVTKMLKKDNDMYIVLSNDMKLKNCSVKPLKMGEATKKYLNGKQCFDFVDFTGKSMLKELLPNIDVSEKQEEAELQPVNGFMTDKHLTKLDIAHVFKDVSLSR